MVASGGAYGDRKAMESIQSGAPMERAQGPTAADAIPFGAPSQAPTEPVTAGAALGPGIGPEAAGIQSDSQATLDQMKPLVRSLEMAANLPSATPEMRSFVRALKAKLAAR